MQYEVIPVTPLQQNCSLIWSAETGHGAVIDPGGEIDRILAVVKARNIELQKILITHAHLDHAGAAAELAAKFDLPIEGPHRDDQSWVDSMPEQARMFGFPPVESFTPTRWLQGGDRVAVGDDIELEVYHCPGHTAGHVIFFHRASQLAIVGDVLFQGSIGRSDLPGGDLQTLLTSIREQLWPLGNDVRFVPGHGPMSTFGAERAHNPFVGDRVHVG